MIQSEVIHDLCFSGLQYLGSGCRSVAFVTAIDIIQYSGRRKSMMSYGEESWYLCLMHRSLQRMIGSRSSIRASILDAN